MDRSISPRRYSRWVITSRLSECRHVIHSSTAVTRDKSFLSCLRALPAGWAKICDAVFCLLRWPHLFLTRNAMHSADCAVASARCLSVRLSVCLSVTRRYCIEKAKRNYHQTFPPSGSHTILVFRTKRYGNIPTGTRLTGALYARV